MTYFDVFISIDQPKICAYTRLFFYLAKKGQNVFKCNNFNYWYFYGKLPIYEETFYNDEFIWEKCAIFLLVLL